MAKSFFFVEMNIEKNAGFYDVQCSTVRKFEKVTKKYDVLYFMQSIYLECGNSKRNPANQIFREINFVVLESEKLSFLTLLEFLQFGFC